MSVSISCCNVWFVSQWSISLLHAGCGLDVETVTDGRVSSSNLPAVLIINCVFNCNETEVKSTFGVLPTLNRLANQCSWAEGHYVLIAHSEAHIFKWFVLHSSIDIETQRGLLMPFQTCLRLHVKCIKREPICKWSFKAVIADAHVVQQLQCLTAAANLTNPFGMLKHLLRTHIQMSGAQMFQGLFDPWMWLCVARGWNSQHEPAGSECTKIISKVLRFLVDTWWCLMAWQ